MSSPIANDYCAKWVDINDLFAKVVWFVVYIVDFLIEDSLNEKWLLIDDSKSSLNYFAKMIKS